MELPHMDAQFAWTQCITTILKVKARQNFKMPGGFCHGMAVSHQDFHQASNHEYN